MSFLVELHNGRRNLHTKRGTRVGRIGSSVPIGDFSMIEPQLLSPRASEQEWTHAFALDTNTQTVVGVWKHELGTTRCLAIANEYTSNRTLPYFYPHPRTKVMTGGPAQGAGWARQILGDENCAAAVVVCNGQVYLAWECAARSEPQLVITGGRAIFA